MILYHGSYIAIPSPKISYSRSRLDFGTGFYLTNIYEQARNWAVRFKYRHCPCIVNVFELDYETVQKEYCIKTFEYYDKEWLHFIIRNREGQPVKDYDVIIGGVANDRVFNTIELFQNGYWHKVKIHSTTDEPYIEDWAYGDCLGCEVKLPNE